MWVRLALIVSLCSCQPKGDGKSSLPRQASADAPESAAGDASANEDASATPDARASGPESEPAPTSSPSTEPAPPPPPPAGLPIGYAIQADVPEGKKPQMRIEATQNVGNLRVELKRQDGKVFTTRRGTLAQGQHFTVPIGDGQAGRTSYQVTLSGTAAGEPWKHAFAIETLVRAPLRVAYDFEHLDLDERVLQFKLSRPAARAELVVFGEDGATIGTGSATYRDPSPDDWLSIRWDQKKGSRVLKMQLRVESRGGLATRVELIPWSVTIDHEDVNFATDSATIEASEHGKLDASLAEIRKVIERSKRFLKVKLYIAGHTDTVGSEEKNRRLSLRRAQAIARYMRSKGLRIPIDVAGFGEQVPKVDTPDNTDHRANRRADYVLGPADGAPPFKGRYLQVRPPWKRVP